MAKTSGSFKKGDPNNKGKPKGAVSHLTRTVKEALLIAFNQMQEHPTANLYEWGVKNQTAFYQVASKLIPTEVNAKVEQMTIKVIRE